MFNETKPIKSASDPLKEFGCINCGHRVFIDQPRVHRPRIDMSVNGPDDVDDPAEKGYRFIPYKPYTSRPRTQIFVR